MLLSLRSAINREDIRVLEALCQKPGTKTKYIFLIVSQHHNDKEIRQSPDGQVSWVFLKITNSLMGIHKIMWFIENGLWVDF